MTDDEEADDDDDAGFDFAKSFGSGAARKPKKSAMKKPTRSSPSKALTPKSKMKIPILVFAWIDDNGFERVTLVGHLPAGAFKKGCVSATITKNRIVSIKLDYTHLVMLDPMKYNKAFKDNHDNLIYDESHSRTVQHKETVKEMKGYRPTTRLTVEMKISMPTWVENKFTDEEGFDGFQVFKAGNESNPQLIIHLEMMGKQTGHDDKQADDYEDFCESSSSSSSDSDDSD